MNVRGKRIPSVSTSVRTRKEVTVVLVTMVTDCVTTPTVVRVGEINHGIYEKIFAATYTAISTLGVCCREKVLVETLEVALFCTFSLHKVRRYNCVYQSLYTQSCCVRAYQFFCSFLDVDECSLSNHTCSHKCNNTVGSFTCSCPDGYQLNNDGSNCTGKTI
jgi:hypothetical protein